MKVIERPTSTTYVDEYTFHLIKNKEEVKNVLVGYSREDILVIRRTIDMDTFTPILWFALKREHKQFYDWLKYVVPYELILGSPLENISAY
jgi:hypothetical protein